MSSKKLLAAYALGGEALEKNAFIGMVGDSFESGKKTNKSEAQRHGTEAGMAKRLREKEMAHYLLNPHVPGPLSELRARLNRRSHASRHEEPVVSSMYGGMGGMIRGGKAGEAEMKKESSADTARKAALGLGALGLAGAAAYGLNVGTAGAEESKKAHKTKAEAFGKNVETAKDIRKNHKGAYFANPSSYGPLSEAVMRLRRRHHASAAERPYLTAAIPMYGMIRGGKAGESKKD